MTDRRVGLLLLCAALVAGATFRAPRVASEVGISWPDEIHQSLEPAHRVVYGYGLVAWEFVQGARSWAFPGLVAGVLAVLRGFGADAPAAYLPWVRGFFALLSLGTAAAVFGLARRLGATTPSSALVAALYALAAPVLYFSHRSMPEVASALPVTAGLLLLASRRGTAAEPRRGVNPTLLAGGALLAVATLLRLQNALFCLGALAWVATWRDRRALLGLTLTLVGGAAVHGVLDWVTWGRPFHSALVYLDVNVVQDRASDWGTAPATYYLRVLATSMPVVLACLAALWIFAFTGPRRQRPTAVFLIAVGFVVAHSLVPHKEYRFILPALPLLFAAASPGVDQISSMAPRPAIWTLVAACALASALLAPRLTFGALGAYERSPSAASSAWDAQGELNRLLLDAGRREDLCGLKLEGAHLAWTGGYAFLHRPVPLYGHDGPPRDSGRYSHVITSRTAGPGEPLAVDGQWALFRLPVERCTGAERYEWLLR